MPHDTTPTKKCARCREVLPATDEYFEPHKIISRGLRKWCKVCVREYTEQHPSEVGEPRRLYMREFRKRPGNRERIAMYNRRRHKANRLFGIAS